MKRPFVLGLTGSIGMGKTTVAALLRDQGLSVLSADAIVHDLLKKGGAAVRRVARLFPETEKEGRIDRKRLGARVFGDPAAIKKLENILHPLVWREEVRFIRAAAKKKEKGVVLEIPLLFETGAEKRMDAVLCVYCTLAQQKARVLTRPGMTPSLFRAIRAKQMSMTEKRRRADYSVSTSCDLETTRTRLLRILRKIEARHA